MRTYAIFHSGGITGPLRTLLPRLESLADVGEVELLFPWSGAGSELACGEFAVETAAYGPTVMPASPAETLLLPVRLVRELNVLRRAVRATKPDVVVVATAYLPLALLAARLENVPTVLYAAELLGAGVRRGWKATIGAASFCQCTRMATRIVAASEQVARQFPAGEVEVVAPGIPPAAPNPVRLPGTQPRIAIVGALSRGRGQDVALDALPLIRGDFPAASLLVAGEPHPRRDDEVFAAALSARAGKGVHFLGAVTDIPSLIAAADVVIAPNRVDEGFGRVPFEAIAAGTPIVSSPFGAAARFLENNVHLLVVPAERPDLLAEAVIRLLNQQTLAAHLVANGRRWVTDNLAEDNLSARFVEVVHRTAGGARAASRANT